MSRRLPTFVSRDDLESSALLGLTEAASRYDTGRGEPFSAFALKRIRGAVLDHLRRSDILGRHDRRRVRLAAKATRELEAKLGRSVSDAEIAASMGIDKAKFDQFYAGAREAVVVHLDDLSRLVESGPAGAEIVESQRRKAALMHAIGVLSERDRIILYHYYRHGLGLREIGEILGLTEGRICQLHAKALLVLRGLLS